MLACRRLAPLLVGAFLAACEDSTGPSTAERLAASRFDALGQSRIQAGDGFGAIAARHAALAIRAGIRPTRVSITVDGSTEQYLALQVEHAFPGVTADPLVIPPLVIRSMVAWRGSRAERVISITVPGDTGTFSNLILASELPPEGPLLLAPSVGVMFERGGPAFFSVDGGARSTRQSIGAECPVPRRSTQTSLPVLGPTTCHAAVFFTRFNMRVVEGSVLGTTGVRARVVQMGAHDIAGIRLVYPPLPDCIVC